MPLGAALRSTATCEIPAQLRTTERSDPSTSFSTPCYQGGMSTDKSPVAPNIERPRDTIPILPMRNVVLFPHTC